MNKNGIPNIYIFLVKPYNIVQYWERTIIKKCRVFQKRAKFFTNDWSCIFSLPLATEKQYWAANYYLEVIEHMMFMMQFNKYSGRWMMAEVTFNS